MKDLLFGVLTKTLNKSSDELADLILQKSDGGEDSLKEGSQELVLSLFEERFNKLKTDSEVKSKSAYQNGYKKAKDEVLTEFEKQVKEKYGVEDKIEGIELVDAIVDKHKSTDSKLTPDKIKLTDTYRNREKELMKEMQDKLTEETGKREALQKDFEKQGVWSVISSDIGKRLMGKNPVLPKNATASENLKSLFINSFKDYEWQLDKESGEHVAIKEGKRIEDKFGNEVKFSALVDGRIPDYFDLQVQTQKGSAGNDNKTGGTLDGVPASFESEDTYNKYLDSTTDSEKREQAYKNWKSQS